MLKNTIRPQNKNLQPGVHQQGIRDASGPVLEAHEVSVILRCRGEKTALEWFGELSAQARGDLIKAAHLENT